MMDVYDWHNLKRNEWAKEHPGKKYEDYHRHWRGLNVPVCDNTPEWYKNATEAVIAALMQEGVIAWNGDGVSLIVQMMASQANAAKEQTNVKF